VGSAGHVLHSDASGVLNVNALLLMLGWDEYGFQKCAMGHVKMNLSFCIRWDMLGHVVHCVLSAARNINTLLLMLVWDECGFQKKCAETHHAKLVFCIRWDLWVSLYIALRPTRNTSMHYFSFSFGTGSDFTKSVTGHVTLNLHFCV
jgi:hypothetical protein